MKDGRTLLVTGASSGIGRAVAMAMLAKDHTVIGLARDFGKVSFSNVRFHTCEIDLSKLGGLPARLDELRKDYPEISGVVLCAGMGRFGSLEEFSYGQIRALIDLNLVSQVFVTRAFLPSMKRRGSGDLIFIGSEAGLSGGRRGAVYSATKFALRGLTQSLRLECANSGVRVTIVNPGMVKTDFFSELQFEPGEHEDNYILPEDVAETVLNILEMRRGTVIDEINLSPQKRVVQFKKSAEKNEHTESD